MLQNKEPYRAVMENKRLMALFFILFGMVLLLVGLIYRHFVWPFLFALIFYIALRPVFDIALRVVRRRTLASLAVISAFFMLIIVPAFLLLLALASQTYQFYVYLQQHLDLKVVEDAYRNNPLITQFYGMLNIDEAEMARKSVDVVRETALSVFSNLTGVLNFSVQFIVNFFFMLLILFFLFKDGYRLEGPFYRILPWPDDIEMDVVGRLKEVIKVLVAGNLFVMFLQGTVVGIGFYAANVEMPLLWGSIAAILSLIPVVGTALVWIPAVLFLIAEGGYVGAVLLGVWCCAAYLLLENLFKPAVFGKKLNFHPLVFFFLRLGSIQTFGLAGIIVGPILLTLFFSLWEIYKLVSGYDAAEFHEGNG